MQHRHKPDRADRAKLVMEFWDRSKYLSTKNAHYKNFVQNFFYFLLREDMGKIDITTNSVIKKSKKISAWIVAKESGIFAGLGEFSAISKGLKIEFFKNDGAKIKKGDKLIEISGNAKEILERERTFLNLLQRMSGIATLTNELSGKLENKVKLAATRKTLWGLIDKKAVIIGGGLSHRLSLSDAILVKDNHLKILNYDIEKALNPAKSNSKYVEIEVESEKQALAAAKSINGIKENSQNLFAIMFDKMQPEDIKAIIEKLKEINLYENILFEASGGITPDTLESYSGCGIDIVSMGYITNSAKALDMSMEIIRIR